MERTVGQLVQEFVAGEIEEARQAGQLGFYARVLTQATMPHSRPAGIQLVRRNGSLTLRMTAAGPGLPYGAIPRVLLAWMTTEAVRTRSPELVLGDHLAGFMRQLDLVPTGGRWGTIPRLRTQMVRLFTTVVAVSEATAEREEGAGWLIAGHYKLWWSPKEPAQAGLWQSTVSLTPEFYAALVDRPIPIDMAALRALKRSPLALDLYTWLTYRMSYLRRSTTVPWEAMMAQFGADYARVRKFREKFAIAMPKVLAVYPQLRVKATGAGLELAPSPPHIARLTLLRR